jgi:hypothetical protein
MKLNDDKSPLTDLLNCIVCNETMKLEKSAPDGEGGDLIQYRCELCERIERVRLFRRSQRCGGLKAKGNDAGKVAAMDRSRGASVENLSQEESQRG